MIQHKLKAIDSEGVWDNKAQGFSACNQTFKHLRWNMKKFSHIVRKLN